MKYLLATVLGLILSSVALCGDFRIEVYPFGYPYYAPPPPYPYYWDYRPAPIYPYYYSPHLYFRYDYRHRYPYYPYYNHNRPYQKPNCPDSPTNPKSK